MQIQPALNEPPVENPLFLGNEKTGEPDSGSSVTEGSRERILQNGFRSARNESSVMQKTGDSGRRGSAGPNGDMWWKIGDQPYSSNIDYKTISLLSVRK